MAIAVQWRRWMQRKAMLSKREILGCCRAPPVIGKLFVYHQIMSMLSILSMQAWIEYLEQLIACLQFHPCKLGWSTPELRPLIRLIQSVCMLGIWFVLVCLCWCSVMQFVRGVFWCPWHVFWIHVLTLLCIFHLTWVGAMSSMYDWHVTCSWL